MSASIEQHSVSALNKATPKYVRVLARLLEGPLHRMEAERFPISDHVLNTTISELKKRGLVIYAQMIRLPGYAGLGAHVAQYTLAPESRARALEIISERGA